MSSAVFRAAKNPRTTGLPVVFAIMVGIGAIFWPTIHGQLAATAGGGASVSGLLIVPAFVMVVWSQRAELATLPMRVFWPAFAGLTLAGALWLVGELVLSPSLATLAVVLMIPLAVMAILGPRWAKGIAFASTMLLFALPIASPFIPWLVSWTADFSVAALRLSGIPVFREGAYLLVPSGNWAIADACSGTGYLTTCLMLGVLYAWTLYRSTARRIAFAAGAIAIGVVGNWIRAYTTILVAHVSDNRYLRDDHSVFGWAVFIVLLLAYYALARRFTHTDGLAADATEARPKPDGEIAPVVAPPARKILLALVCAGVVLLPWPFVESHLLAPDEVTRMDAQDLGSSGGWVAASPNARAWKPVLSNPSIERMQTFEKNGRRVGLHLGLFRRQTWNSKLVTSVNRLADSDDPRWSQIERGQAAVSIAGRRFDANSGVILGPDWKIMAWHWYWISGVPTGSDSTARLAHLKRRLSGGSDFGAWIAIYTDVRTTASDAEDTLRVFLADMGPALHGHLAALQGDGGNGVPR